MRRLGMPVGVGIARTKTLAKLANWAAKKWKKQTGCVVALLDPVRQEKLLRYAPVEEVWGIGRRLNVRLQNDLGIHTAWELSQANPQLLRRQFSVNVERTARELQGVPCFPFVDGTPDRKQQIICSRSFGEKLFAQDHLASAVTAFASTAAGKLRAQNSMTCCVQVFAQTSPFSGGEQYRALRIVPLAAPSADTRDIVQAALSGLQALYRPGPAYAKAGVMLTQFVERGTITGDLFAPQPRRGSDQLMAVMDAINAKQGRGTVRLARDTTAAGWSMKREYLTPEFTTRWGDLPAAR